MDIQAFRQTVLRYYQDYGRHDLPWRQPQSDGVFDPYHIVVSELMLQQTQVGRVIPKFEAFIAAYPSFAALAQAPLSDVLRLWSGLGYNRRAKFLWQTAHAVITDHNGVLPETQRELVALPGIGPYTAGAIRAYAFNQQAVFIETNIRTVFIHHFFADADKVADAALMPLVESALPEDDVRLWYWALMDYGTYLKQTVGNVSRSSASYTRQSTFQGSRRQVRGQVLRVLAKDPQDILQLQKAIHDERLASVLRDLAAEGLIQQQDSVYQLAT